MILDLPINEYHKRGEVSSSLLKALLISPAHLSLILDKGFKSTKATVLGDAVHAWILQPARFNEMYEVVTEVYQRKTGNHEVGDPKTDEDGDPMTMLKHRTDSRYDIKGEEYKKFVAMIDAYQESIEAQALVLSAEFIEASFFYEDMRVRPDFITKDGWIVDIKTVGGQADKPSSPDNFGRDFFDRGYDLQMYMYYQLVKREMPNIKGFKFLCLDAKIPSGVQIYTFVDGESKWFELGGYRFHKAIEAYKEYKETIYHPVYKVTEHNDLNLSYQAESLLAEYRNE